MLTLAFKNLFFLPTPKSVDQISSSAKRSGIGRCEHFTIDHVSLGRFFTNQKSTRNKSFTSASEFIAFDSVGKESSLAGIRILQVKTFFSFVAQQKKSIWNKILFSISLPFFFIRNNDLFNTKIVLLIKFLYKTSFVHTSLMTARWTHFRSKLFAHLKLSIH